MLMQVPDDVRPLVKKQMEIYVEMPDSVSDIDEVSEEANLKTIEERQNA